LQPDLIGEFLISAVLKDNSDLIDPTLTSVAEPDLPKNAITILTRMSRVSQPFHRMSVDAHSYLMGLVARNFPILAKITVDVALSTGDPAGQVAATVLQQSQDEKLAEEVLA
jgi:hypothetical protein